MYSQFEFELAGSLFVRVVVVWIVRGTAVTTTLTLSFFWSDFWIEDLTRTFFVVLALGVTLPTAARVRSVPNLRRGVLLLLVLLDGGYDNGMVSECECDCEYVYVCATTWNMLIQLRYR